MFSSPTYHAVSFLVVALILIFVFLLIYTFWTRTKKKYWARYGQKFRDLFAPVIFSYIEKARHSRDADAVIKRLTRRQQDIELFINLVSDMSEILHGDDRNKLNWLVNHDLFDTFYQEKLNSKLRSDKLLACVYYAKSGDIQLKVAVRLFELSSSPDIKIAFGSAKALQKSSNYEMRIASLTDFFSRTDATNLMAGELLYLFHHCSAEMYQATDHSLKKLLLNQQIQKGRKEIIIEYIAHHNLYEYSTFLHQYLQKLLYRPENRSIIKHLVKTLGTLRVEQAGPLIRSYASHPDPELRICCVEALNQLGGEENLSFITTMLLDIEFDVRKRIIQTLVHDPDNGHLLLEKFMLTYLKFLSKVSSSESPSNDLLLFVSKLRSITSGIRIASAKKTQRFQKTGS